MSGYNVFCPKIEASSQNLNQTNRSAIEIHSHIHIEAWCWQKKVIYFSSCNTVWNFSCSVCQSQANDFSLSWWRCKQSRKTMNTKKRIILFAEVWSGCSASPSGALYHRENLMQHLFQQPHTDIQCGTCCLGIYNSHLVIWKWCREVNIYVV